MRLLKQLYGFFESCDMSYKTPDEYHRCDRLMNPMKTDPTSCVSIKDKSLWGLSGSCVEKMIRTKTETFRSVCRLTHSKFEITDDGVLSYSFFLAYLLNWIKTIVMGTWCIKQSIFQPKRLFQLMTPFSKLFSSRMKLSWLSHIQRDHLYDIYQCAEAAEDIFKNSHLER